MWENIIAGVSLVVVAIIEAIAARERRQDKKDRDRQAEQETAKEQLLLLLLQGNRAAISLGEATAHAMQRGHTNGDMEAALDYAMKVKRQQKDFLAEQGIHAMYE